MLDYVNTMSSKTLSTVVLSGAQEERVSHARFVVNAPSVVSEIIDGEVVIMNLTSGNYYSSDGVGAVVWGWIDEGKTVSDIERLALERYDASEEDVTAALTAFFDRLIEEKLVRETTTVPSAAALPGRDRDAGAAREHFATPELHVYSDMQDLLLLDPIHDVDEAGWPRPKEDAEGKPA